MDLLPRLCFWTLVQQLDFHYARRRTHHSPCGSYSSYRSTPSRPRKQSKQTHSRSSCCPIHWRTWSGSIQDHRVACLPLWSTTLNKDSRPRASPHRTSRSSSSSSSQIIRIDTFLIYHSDGFLLPNNYAVILAYFSSLRFRISSKEPKTLAKQSASI